MVFSAKLVPKVGQEFRDCVRCVELENLEYSVMTLDNKHAAETLDHGKHCRLTSPNLEERCDQWWQRGDKENLLISAGGIIWLPNLRCIRESIGRFQKCIDQFYTVHEVEDPMEKPLFVAAWRSIDESITITTYISSRLISIFCTCSQRPRSFLARNRYGHGGEEW